MKRCPTCGSSYTDDTLVYCLQDGATLQSSNSGSNPLSMIATLHDDARAEEESTRAIHTSSAPTAEISGPVLETVLNQETRATQRAATGDASTQTAASNVTRAVALAVVVTVLLLGLGGVGAWMFFRGGGDGRGRRAGEQDSNAVSANSSQTANASDNRPDKGGRWFVVLGAFPKDEIGRATERMDAVRQQGFDARVVSSDEYPNMKAGQWLIVMGPFTRNRAEELLDEVRPKFKDAYTKSGW